MALKNAQKKLSKAEAEFRSGQTFSIMTMKIFKKQFDDLYKIVKLWGGGEIIIHVL